MIWVDVEVRKQEGLVAGLVTTAVWFDRYKNGINLPQRFGVVEPQHPTLLRIIVHIEDTEVERLLRVRPATAPSLEVAVILHPSRRVEVLGVKDQRLPFSR